MSLRDPLRSDWDEKYYNDYYNRNQCLYGCPQNSHCEWGFCECNAGAVRKFGHCLYNSDQSDFVRLLRPTSFNPSEPCETQDTCLDLDMNLICHTDLEVHGGGICTCRRDMKWNTEEQECQFYLDVDCSSITYETKPSEAVLEAVEKANIKLKENPIEEFDPLERTETKNESLAHSLLSDIDAKHASDEELKEAFCRDVDVFNFEFLFGNHSDSIPYPACSEVPRTACAVAYDEHDCSSGWKLVIPQGTLKFKWFTSYWKYRNDMETVGVRAGCTLLLFEDSSFNGYNVVIEAGLLDRWVVLGEHTGPEGYQYIQEDVESLQCVCRAY